MNNAKLHDRRRTVMLGTLLGAMALVAADARAADGKPDLSVGAVLAAPCASCHGTDGKSPGSIPALFGRSSGAVEEMMLKYRSGEMPATVMNRIAAGFTPEQIKAIADFFGAVK